MTSRPILSRRAVLRLAGGALAAPALARCASVERTGENPFTLGVASGEPRPDGFVLWTRLAPLPLSTDPARPGGMDPGPVAVEWEVAADAAMDRIVRRGTAQARAEDAHSLHIELAGLEPGRHWWYRFRANGYESPVGRAVTAPAAGAAVDRLRLGFVSCADWQHGYYAAYRRLAEDAPEVVLFLGDYIYEYVDVRRPVLRPHVGGEATDLPGYRLRYAQYKTDPDLQAVHHAAPAIVTWDDHEVHNDYADRWSQDIADPRVFLERRAAAYRAFWEHMPLPSSMRPQGSALPLYRALDWGNLARLWMLDERQYRSIPPCYGPPYGGGRLVTDAACPERRAEDRTMLGLEQERWLDAGLGATRARWNLLSQGVMFAPLNQRNRQGEIAYWTDGWDSNPAARLRLLRRLHETRAANPVVLSGDIHCFFANDLHLDPYDPRSPLVATEFVGTSITSLPPPYEPFKAMAEATPHVRFFESRFRGYAVAELTAGRMTTRFRTIADPKDRNAAAATLASFTVEDGRPGIQAQG
jgi:alkaline phosphatase D